MGAGGVGHTGTVLRCRPLAVVAVSAIDRQYPYAGAVASTLVIATTPKLEAYIVNDNLKKWLPWLAVAVVAIIVIVIIAMSGGDDGTAEDTTTTTAAPGETTTTAPEDDTTTTTAGEEPAEVFKVAFVYVGPTSDKGWSWTHAQGVEELKAEFGDAIEITTLESIPEGADSERVFNDLAAEGNKVIFGTSFGYMDPMLAAAENHPDTVFMHATGYKLADNMGNYFGAAEEGRYLTGMAAGAATTTNKIGYVAAFPIPEVLRGINAFTLGVLEVNPEATVQVVWTSTWFDPPTEGAAANSLLDAGADVIAMHQDSQAPGQAADAVGAKWVGYNSDMTEFAPNAWLTAPTWDWAPFYIKTVQEVMNGTWKSEAYYGNMADGLVGIAPFGVSVNDETRALIEQRASEIKSGAFKVFPDTVIGQDGTERPLGNIFEMDYFVKGVVGSPTG